MCNVQTWAVLVVTGDQQRHTEWSRHDALLAFRTLTKPQRKVAYCLRATLYPQRLGIVEGVVLALDSCVLDHASRIGLQTRHSASNVTVDLDNLLDGAGLEEGGGYALFDAEDDALAGCNLVV